MADRNFDDLAERFKNKVYSGLKGDIRQDILRRDYEEFLPQLFPPQSNLKPLQIFDAGGGQGQMARYFATLGHGVVLCDISQAMLKLAATQIDNDKLSDRISLVNQSIDNVSSANPEKFDLVSCHAVIEWVDEPLFILQSCLRSLKPGGFFSLTYYNVNGAIYKNLLRTNFKKIKKGSWQGRRGSLTPTSPLKPEQVNEWISELNVELICESGIRVFYDNIFSLEDRARDPSLIREMELRFSREQPYKYLGRYIHLLLKKN